MDFSEFHHKHEPADFKTAAFARDYKAMIDDYVALRIDGVQEVMAFVRAFGSPHGNDTAQRKEFLEHNPYAVAELKRQLAAKKFSELWSPKRAVHEMLCLARDPFNKDSTRLAAMKELNLMCGIVVIDENGKTRAGKTLDDFYNGLSARGVPKAEVDAA